MKLLVVALCLLCAVPVSAKEATFANNVLKIDTVQVGADIYSAELTPVPNLTPLTFTVTRATKVATTTAVAATFSGTTLTVPNALINGTMRVNAKLTLVGQNPLKFQLSTYSVLRTVMLDTIGQTLAPGRIFNVKYTGSALATDKIKLKIGTTDLPFNARDNLIVGIVPAAASGSLALTVDLDSDRFELLLAVSAGTDIANPKPYISSYVSDVATDLQRLGLPATLIDTASITSQLATLPDADAKLAALQIRENLEPLLTQVNQLLGSSPLLDDNTYALTITTRDDCERWGKRFAEANYLVNRAFSWVSDGLGSVSVVGAVKTGVGLAALAIGADVAARYLVLIETNCLVLADATFTQSPLLQGDIVLTKPIEMFESRPRSFQLTELYRIDNSLSNTYTPIATELKTNLTLAMVVAQQIPLASAKSVANVLASLINGITAGGTSSINTRGHKFSIRTVSDSSVTASTINIVPGSLTLLFDIKDLTLAEGASRTFKVELYNAEDGISITVPVKLNGASLLEDLKEAAVGTWSVTNVEGKTTYGLEVRAGGTGVYKVQTATSCANGSLPVAGICEYKMTWSITKSGSKYIFNDNGFWHPGFSDPAIVERAGLTLPLTGFTVHAIGDPSAVGIRYTKQ